MAAGENLIPLLYRLLDQDPAIDAQRDLARALEAENVLVFVCDPELGVPLPAPGFPQTLPEAKDWQGFLKSLEHGAPGRCELMSPWSQQRVPCIAVRAWEGTSLVLLGGSPVEDDLVSVGNFLPLLGRALQIKLEARITAAHLQENQVAMQRTRVHTQSLDLLRRELQTALDEAVTERTKAESATSEVRRINEELQSARDVALEASRAKSTFLANMSHELRTPLNAIIGYSEIIEDESSHGNFESLKDDAAKIRDAGQHLLVLISDILDLSKIEAGKMDLELSTFQVGDLLHEVVNLIEPMAKQRNNQLRVEGEDQGYEMVSDRSKLRQILVNLASNAVKFTTDGLVQLSAVYPGASSPEQNSIRFDVSDTGSGMMESELSRLFKDFSQLDSNRIDQRSGTGLGLAISQRLSAMLGGRITVQTEYGRGSTFSVLLPRQVNSAHNAGASTPVPF